MKIILLEKIRNLGGIGAEISVKNGYARNFLLPQKKAITATKENLAKIAERKAELEKKSEDVFVHAKTRAEQIAKLAILTVHAKVSEEGKLFGSIGLREIIAALKNAGIEVKKSELSLPQGSIRQIGEYDIDVLLHSDITETLKVKIEPEGTAQQV